MTTSTEGDARDEVAIDPENPWLGLFSYSEANRAYFHGRGEEAAELSRRVQRKLLTVLFGQSGLGKTSLLRAGLVPRLRAEGFCPVYVRIDYAPESPAPAEQIKQAIFRATSTAGVWTRPGAAIEGESLWEFMHHRGDLLRDANGQTLLPFLIFDQFEEIFTLGQADDAGRERAKAFLGDLADLVENRPPAALEARLDSDDSAIDDFDFSRADYRILIALREDDLAHLEGVKAIMPSVTQNRMRLARMNGAQALSAVVKPGGRLVSQEVAESIVRFVAGGSELVNAEIEPSLLSLVCRELNTTRIAHGDAEISAALLAGSRDTILTEFYERALADQPAGVRRVIEDDLLTESGYRESLAEERVRKALANAGATPDALATLVNRRLLRIEERLDMRRVELTHDVLCSVVAASRTLRREREARDEAERQLAAQREREAASHRALVRARMVATVCAVLMVVAVAGGAYGWISQRRAHFAEIEAQKSRSEAEKLVNFLIEDFYAELEPTGRLETLGKLADMTVKYYDGLPPQLVTPRTRVFRAMALAREGAAQQSSGNIDASTKSLGEAEKEFRSLLAEGDRSGAVVYGLALTLFTSGKTVIGSSGGGAGTVAQLDEAASLLRPLVAAPDSAREARKLYADTLNYISHTQPLEQAVATCEEARKVLVGIGALDLSDLNSAASYADTADSEARHHLSLGHLAQARALETEVYEIAEKVLAQRPGDLHALADRSWAAELLSALADQMHDRDAGADYARRAALAGENEVRFNPSDLGSWQRWALGLRAISDEHYARGEIAEAIAAQRAVLALESDSRRPASLGPVLWYHWIPLLAMQAETGDMAGAAASLKAFKRDADEFAAQLAADDPRRRLIATSLGLDALAQLIGGSAQAAYASATRQIEVGRAIETAARGPALVLKQNILRGSLETAAKAGIRIGHYHEAEAFAQQLLDIPSDGTNESDPREGRAQVEAVRAHAMALQGRGDEALEVLAPGLAYYREQEKAGAASTQFRHDFAYALGVSALARSDKPAERAQRKADLDDAARVLDGASAEAKRMAGFREVAALLGDARG
jgi:hypothetical protein